jgi:fatty-acyl-CoA synthase
MITQTIGELYDRCTENFGTHIALTYKGFNHSYAQVGENARRIANALQGLGLAKGDKVAFLMANCPEYVFCEYATAKIGTIRVPLAVLLSSSDHIYMMNQVKAKVLIYHEKMAGRVHEMMPDLKTVEHFICVADRPQNVQEGHLHLQTLMQEHEPVVAPVAIDPEDLVGIYFTGGTTGKPKGVMLSHRAWVYTILMEMLEFGFGWHEVFAYATPLTHAGGCLMLPVLLRRGRCVILDYFDPADLLSQIEREKVTMTFLVPTMIYVLLDYADREKCDLSSLANVIYGASAIAPERLKQAVETFGPIFTQLFGQTEAPMTLSALSRAEHIVDDPDRERLVFSSAGRPTFHTRVRLVDEAGNDVSDGSPGEVVVQCANMMSGYYENPEATADTIRDGWLHTGDIATMDEEGLLYIVDRKKDMIVSGGFNIFPREIEDVLFEHPAVKGAAVVGTPHPKWGEQVTAVVALHSGKEATAEELIDFVKARKGSMMAPKKVQFKDEIPLTNLGKVDKKTIRAEFWKDRDRMVS